MIRVNSLQVDSRLLPLSLQANAGEVWHVIGPNGCGKSTLLAALAGMIPFSGSVQVDGLDVSQASLSELARHRALIWHKIINPAFNCTFSNIWRCRFLRT